MIIGGKFDPVTSSEVKEIRKIQKENRLRDIEVCIKGEGVLPHSERERLLRLALKPYRHIHVISSDHADLILSDYEKEEEKARSGYFRLVPKSVSIELIEENAYLKQIAHALCNPKRAIHSQGVAETAVALAHAHHLDEKKAERMGYLHDVTKALSDEEGRRMLEIWHPEDVSLNPKIYHSRTAVFFLKQNMGLYDSSILNPIWHHTLGTGKSDYDRILYIADKIEPNRNYDTTVHMALARKDLKKAMALVVREGEQYRRKEKNNG